MATEIERKFLVNKEKWSKIEKLEGHFLRQGYLSDAIDCTIRVRETSTDGFITIKGKTKGITRAEFEYPIPKSDAAIMLNTLAKTRLSKTRYKITVGKHTWDVDVFHETNEGLILAEIELEHPDEVFEKPEWVTEEVSDHAQYFNSNLAK